MGTDEGRELAVALSQALRAVQGGDPSRLGGAVEALRQALAASLSVRSHIDLGVDGGVLRLNDVTLLPRNPREGTWFKELTSGLAERGVRALLLGGSWDPTAVPPLLDALSRESYPAIAAAMASVPAPARAVVLDAQQTAALRNEPQPEPVSSATRATLTYTRLVAVSQALNLALAEGRPPDVYDGAIRATLRDAIDALPDANYERRLLALTLLPRLEHSSQAANVTVLSLAMGRLVGLTPRAQLGLGYAAFFHDLGRAGEQPPAPDEAEAALERLARGLRLCLSGSSADSLSATRLAVVFEHHREREGLPGVELPSLVTGQIVAAASAFERMEAGGSGQPPLQPHVAMAQLARKGAHDPDVVALLQSVLGRAPRGSFLKLTDGSVAVVVDGGGRRGSRPVVRTVGGSGGLVAVDDPSMITREVVDPSTLGVAAFQAVLAGGATAEEEEDHLGIDAPSSGIAQLDAEEAEAAGAAVQTLQKAIHALGRFPTSHSRAQRAIQNTLLGVGGSMEGGSLDLNLRRDGVYVGDQRVASRGKVDPLLSLLRPAGLRGLKIEMSALHGGSLEGLLHNLATAAREGDPATALWAANLQGIDLRSYDPFCPEAVAQGSNPLESWVNDALKSLRASVPPSSSEVDSFCARLSAPDAAEPPERAALRERAQADPLVERALIAIQWAQSRQPPPPPSHVGRFVAAVVSWSLWRDPLDVSQEVVDQLCNDDGDLPGHVATHLATPANVELLVRRLRQGEGEPDVAGGVEFLRCLGAVAVDPVCRVYDTLSSDEAMRRLLATFLVEHVRTKPEALVPLTLSRHPQIAREALILLGAGGPASPGLQLLEGFAEDKSKPNLAVRAAVAQEVLEEASGAGTRKQVAEALGSSDKDLRVKVLTRVAKSGDPGLFELLVDRVRGREFANQDEDEIQVTLAALSACGGGRAVRVLEELAAKQKGFSLTGATRRLGKAASARLQALKSEVQATKTQRLNLKGVCMRCKFENQPKAKTCLQCGHDLNAAPTRKVKRPSMPAKGPQLAGGFASKAAAAKAAPDLVLAWLSCPLFAPVPLGPKPVVKIGRAPGSDLELIHESVSREHVLIRIAGEQMTLEDRSTYGTWVNGQRVMTSPLKAGDVITVGPFDVNVEGAQVDGDRDSDTRPLRTFASSEAIGGRLERVSLSEVLQQIEFNEKTGTLEVFADGETGRLVIYEGKPVFAEMGDLRDNEAVLRMLSHKRGNFSFRAKIEAGEMTMSITLTGLLMEAARVLDEAAAPE